MRDETLPRELEALGARVLDAAFIVHRELGPGFLESVYEEALSIELTSSGIAFERQLAIPIAYQGRKIAEHRLDLLVAKEVVVELKSVEIVLALHRAQVTSYLRAIGAQLGYVINFNSEALRFGIKRVIISDPSRRRAVAPLLGDVHGQ